MAGTWPLQDLYTTRQRLLQKGVTFCPDIAVMEVGGPRGARFAKGFDVTPTSGKNGPGTIVVLAMGQRVEDALYFSLKGKVKELYRIGDAVSPRKVDMAIWEGHKLGREI